jgi:hypothetical protein
MYGPLTASLILRYRIKQIRVFASPLLSVRQIATREWSLIKFHIEQLYK